MADQAYVTKSDGVRNTQVVIRIDVPTTGTNLAGHSWIQVAGEEYAQRKKLDPDVNSRWPGKDDSALLNGSVVEVMRTWTQNVENPDQETENAFNIWLTKTVAAEKKRLKSQLNFWGKEATI